MSMDISNPLLNKSELSIIKTIKTSFIIDTYKKAFADLSIEKFLTEPEIYLCQCSKTKYRFFYPFNIAGDAAFYEYLQQFDWYYMPWKWEHQKVMDRIKALGKNIKVLEIGCAKGSFVAKLTQENIETIGLELNEKAGAEGRANGLNILNETIQKHASKNYESYDIVCSFQVMEHIPNIGEVLQASVNALKKGGKLFISVPNNYSFLGLDESNPLNLPPHHMGLWNETSLRNIAPFFGLKLDNIYLEPLQDYHKQYFKGIINKCLEEQYTYYRKKYKIIGRLYFKIFRHQIMRNIYKRYPQIENFTIIAEYTKI